MRKYWEKSTLDEGFLEAHNLKVQCRIPGQPGQQELEAAALVANLSQEAERQVLVLSSLSPLYVDQNSAGGMVHLICKVYYPTSKT